MGLDYTYLAPLQSFVYVAFVVDAYSCKIGGWWCPIQRMPVSFWMLWNRPFLIANRSPVSDGDRSIITATDWNAKRIEFLLQAGWSIAHYFAQIVDGTFITQRKRSDVTPG